MSTATTCTQGSDDTCVALSATSCCYFMEIKSVPATQSTYETAAIKTLQDMGFPYLVNGSGYVCIN